LSASIITREKENNGNGNKSEKNANEENASHGDTSRDKGDEDGEEKLQEIKFK
jgi:hypothetical protein